MQPVETPHDCEIGVRHRARQVIDAAATDPQNLRLPGDRQIVLAVDHHFALSNPALASSLTYRGNGGLVKLQYRRNGQALHDARFVLLEADAALDGHRFRKINANFACDTISKFANRQKQAGTV
jgi:hypothetical protein